MVTYTSRIKLTKQATGANANTWGEILNANVFSVVDQFSNAATVLFR